jgi:hypothetical protein
MISVSLASDNISIQLDGVVYQITLNLKIIN